MARVEPLTETSLAAAASAIAAAAAKDVALRATSSAAASAAGAVSSCDGHEGGSVAKSISKNWAFTSCE